MKTIAGVLSTALLLSASSVNAADWELIEKSEGVTTWRREYPDSDIVEFKGRSVVNVHISQLMTIFLDIPRATEWVDMLVESRVLSEKSPIDRVIYQKYDLSFPADDRDYVMRLRYQIDSDKGTLSATYVSVEHPKMPEQDCCVRAQVSKTFWKFSAVDGKDQTKVDVSVMTDPKGMLPTWIVNSIQEDWPRVSILALKARAAKGDVGRHPDYASW